MSLLQQVGVMPDLGLEEEGIVALLHRANRQCPGEHARWRSGRTEPFSAKKGGWTEHQHMAGGEPFVSPVI